MRLDPVDTPEGIGGSAGGLDDGPRFAVPGVPRRESITRRMAAKASTSLKRKAHAYAGAINKVEHRGCWLCLQAGIRPSDLVSERHVDMLNAKYAQRQLD